VSGYFEGKDATAMYIPAGRIGVRSAMASWAMPAATGAIRKACADLSDVGRMRARLPEIATMQRFSSGSRCGGCALGALALC
jgi:hypothetical protein